MQLEQVYGEIFRVLKPGAMFATYEWVGTSSFDPDNAEHVRIMDEINYGNGLPVRPPPPRGSQRRHAFDVAASVCLFPGPHSM